MRIALIHALKHSIAPIEDAFARLWPTARLANLLDDSLAADLARDGALTPAMTGRFLTLARYARASGADAILFTCSAFGPCIEACARELAPLPVLKPNQAMIEDALALVGAGGSADGRAGGGTDGRIGLLASFAPTLELDAGGVCRGGARRHRGAASGRGCAGRARSRRRGGA